VAAEALAGTAALRVGGAVAMSMAAAAATLPIRPTMARKPIAKLRLSVRSGRMNPSKFLRVLFCFTIDSWR
jgi:hypothetical protein